MSTAFRLDDEVALITGGGTGIGLSIASCMVEAGAKVVLTGRREDVLQRACRELGPSSAHLVFDVTRFSDARSLIDQASAKFGMPVSILVKEDRSTLNLFNYYRGVIRVALGRDDA